MPRNSYGQERRENETQADYLHGLTHKTIELVILGLTCQNQDLCNMHNIFLLK